eukprot:6174082-Pyramimonas_sp.AAC.1
MTNSRAAYGTSDTTGQTIKTLVINSKQEKAVSNFQVQNTLTLPGRLAVSSESHENDEEGGGGGGGGGGEEDDG